MSSKGTILIPTMVILLIVVLLSGFIFQITSQDLFMIERLKKSAQAQCLAEAGLAHALAVLGTNFSDKDDASKFPLTPLGPGTFDATVTTQSGTNRVLIVSVGTVGNVQRRASAEVKAPTTSALVYILAGGSTIDLRLTASTTADITGDVYALNNIDLRAVASGASINIHNAGNVYAGGSITSTGNVSTGTLNSNWSNVVGFPVMDFNYYKNIAVTNGFYYSTDKTFSSTSSLPANPAGGVIYVDGNVTITAAQTTRACIIASNNIEITQGTTTVNQFSNFPAMMTQTGNITIRSTGASVQGALVAAGLVYSGNNFSISGNHNSATVTGSIIARGTLDESGTQAGLTMIYQAQNPPGMTSSGAQPMTILSYNT
jgi:hypothetical protein